MIFWETHCLWFWKPMNCLTYTILMKLIYWKVRPTRTLSLKNQKCSGGKYSKERVLILVACNMDGSEKVPLLVKEKSSHPRCFKSLKTLSVKYESTKKAWITSEISDTDKDEEENDTAICHGKSCQPDGSFHCFTNSAPICNSISRFWN